jgi:hypothetical protein
LKDAIDLKANQREGEQRGTLIHKQASRRKVDMLFLSKFSDSEEEAVSRILERMHAVFHSRV